MKYILDLCYLLTLAVISPKVIYRIIRHNRYRYGWGERLGKISRRRSQDRCVWIHAVSVGEVNSARTLIAGLKEKIPAYEIVISATTDTGYAQAKSLYGNEHSVFYFPFDISSIMQRAFNRLDPAVCLLMELEVWPNLVATARKRNVPVVVVNGRISDRSFPRYKVIKPLIRKTFAKVTLFLAQTNEYAQRFIALGGRAENTHVTGTLKYDTAEITDKIAGAEELKAALAIGDERLWVVGGTGPGEEKIILEVFRKLKNQFDDLRLAIVPRKPERFEEVAQLITQSGFENIRYSQVVNSQSKIINKSSAVILGDTMGDLRKFYSLAAIVFIGRSLVPMGGSDMMESTAMGKCTIFGPHTFNFKQTVSALLADNGAIEVEDGEELFTIMRECLSNADFVEAIATSGRNVIKNNQGATEKSVEAVVKLLCIEKLSGNTEKA